MISHTTQIQKLASLFPSEVKLNNPLTSLQIEQFEMQLGYEIDQALKELYLFSNGISFIDYCIPRLAQLIRIHTFENKTSFLVTSGDEEYFYHSNSKQKEVYRIETMLGEPRQVADNVSQFLDKFLFKIELLLGYFRKEDIVLYFDDPDLPPGLSEW